MTEEVSHHPGSVCLQYLENTMDPTITGLQEHLKATGGLMSFVFLKKVAGENWYRQFGWKAVPDPERVNKLILVKDKRHCIITVHTISAF